MWMLRVCPLSASNSYPSHDIALYKATDGKVADDKTRETLLKAVKARDAEPGFMPLPSILRSA